MTLSTDACCSPERLREFAHGEIADDGELAFIAEHLANCPSCTKRFDAIEDLPIVALLRTAIADRTLSDAGDEQARAFGDSPPPPALLHHPKWKPLRRLGQGGMGVVYLARHRHLKELDGEYQFRALKIVQKSLASGEKYKERFLNELRAVIGLPEHPHIVRGFDVDVDSLDSFLLLVMEYVPGDDLEHYAAAQPGGRLPVDMACGMILQALSGLDHARKHGVVAHRDLKPENLILSDTGIVKVVDFGLAKIRVTDVDPTHPTQSGLQGCGSPKYAAPEQMNDFAAADGRSDLYSLGCTLYRLLAGHPPFGVHIGCKSVLELWQAHQTFRPASLVQIVPSVPAKLSALVDRLLQKSPAARCQSLIEFAAELFPFASPESQVLTLEWIRESRPDSPESTGPPTRKLPVRWRSGTPFLLTLLLIPILLLIISLAFRNPAKLNSAGDHDLASSPEAMPAAAIAPFDRQQAEDFQKQWAEHLGVPVEWENSLGMKFRLIPPGDFWMGSTDDEIKAVVAELRRLKQPGEDRFVEWVQSEAPQHRVILTHPYYLAVHELTQSVYAKVNGNNPSHHSATGNGRESVAGFDTAKFPVDSVTWNEAIAFCNHLSDLDQLSPAYEATSSSITVLKGHGYRLPPEAEWEFAARAGTTTKFWCGDRVADLVASEWITDNSRNLPHPVGQLKPNPFGLYDILGNQMEWVFDAWDPDYYARFRDQAAVDPTGPAPANAAHIWRGGAWGNYSYAARPAMRNHSNGPNFAGGGIGFRLAISVEAVRQQQRTDSTSPE